MELTEKEILYIINEAKMLLTEDQEGDSIKKAIVLYMDRMGCDKKTAEKFVRIDLRDNIPNLRYKKPGKFILGVTRMFLNGELRNGNTKQELNATLTYVASEAHYNEYDKNLNGLKANELISRFSDAVKADAEKDKERLAQQEYTVNDDYDIVRINNFDESKQYSKYCFPEDVWCITKYPNMLNSYTNNGIGQFYFCLKKGFENMKPEVGEGCPLDEYGVSMFAVCVDGSGRLKTSTCRWNHSNGGGDHILTTEQISKLIGKNFYDVFKPNNRWAEKIEGLKNRIKSGEDLNVIFNRVYNIGDGIFIVKEDGFYNFVDDNLKEILSDKWFDYCNRTKKYNFIEVKVNEEKMFFSIKDRRCYNVNEIFSILNNEINGLLSKGVSLDDFPEGLIEWKLTHFLTNKTEIRCFLNLYNIIDDNKLKFKNWYQNLGTVNDDKNKAVYYRVTNFETGKQCYINDKEENILGVEFDWMSTNISKYGTITISDNGGTNIVSMNNPSKKLCKRSFKNYINVLFKKKDGRFIFMGEDENGVLVCDENGKDLCNTYFTKIKNGYSDIVAFCYKDDKSALLFYDDFTMSEWYDDIKVQFVTEYDPYVTIYKGVKENLLNCLTKQTYPNWYDEIIDMYSSVYKVRIGDKYNLIIEKNGELLLDKWYSDISSFKDLSNRLLVTDSNGKQNILSYYYTDPKEWKFELKHWYDKIESANNGMLYIQDDGKTYEYNPYSYHNNF